MSNKRGILFVLTRTELLDVAARFELQASSRWSKDELVEVVASSRRAAAAEILDGFGRERLKEICRSLGLDGGGRDKASIIDRLVGGKREAVEPRSERSPDVGSRRRVGAIDPDEVPVVEPTPRKRSTGNGTTKSVGDLGFEATLWLTADKLRNNLDAAEYKHVVLGLISLKYISDAIAERYSPLQREFDDGADPGMRP